MKKASRKQSDEAPRPKKCPYCAELIGVGKVHICPVGCCSIVVGSESYEAICPYCGSTFETKVGHVCLELLKLTEPAQ
jgi:hypothetical protein